MSRKSRDTGRDKGESRLARVCAVPAARAVAAAMAIATVVTGVGTAAASGSGAAQPGLITGVTTVAPDSAAAAVLVAAKARLGQKYVYGGDGPTTWDCSGFTSVLWSTVGMVSGIPRTAALQQAWAVPVAAAQVLPGDLYFLGTPATHVGLVVGAGMVLDASASSGKVVLRPLWMSASITFGRVPRASAVPVVPLPGATPAAPVTASPATSAPATAAPAAVAPTTAPVTAVPPAGRALSRDRSSFVLSAEKLVGAPYRTGGNGPSYDDAAVVASAWHRALGRLLPLDRNAVAARTTPVPRSELLPGDLVIYGGRNVWHVGVYTGKGMMVDASRINGRVVERRVFTSPDRRFGRLH